ncbi:hypothetical protein GT50_08365 [Geobacillus stearothermophilus 10]|nr:hypothetical protein GT50_08365 [Geobacillus stearothermophilus 10]
MGDEVLGELCSDRPIPFRDGRFWVVDGDQLPFRFCIVLSFLRTYGFTSYLRNGGLVFHVLI